MVRPCRWLGTLSLTKPIVLSTPRCRDAARQVHITEGVLSRAELSPFCTHPLHLPRPQWVGNAVREGRGAGSAARGPGPSRRPRRRGGAAPWQGRGTPQSSGSALVGALFWRRSALCIGRLWTTQDIKHPRGTRRGWQECVSE